MKKDKEKGIKITERKTPVFSFIKETINKHLKAEAQKLKTGIVKIQVPFEDATLEVDELGGVPINDIVFEFEVAQYDSSFEVTSNKVAQLIQEKFKGISSEYPGYSIRFGGEQEETAKSMKSLLISFCIAVLLIFVILATQFNSLIQPAVVLLTIPFGMIGVVFAFWIHGRPFSFLAVMGIIGLTGIVVNDSIVLVDFINKMRREGVSRRESIMEAGALRLRPVLITTFTTVAGLSTVAYGIGGSDPFLKPMALAIAWGLAFATVLTLIVMPCFYAIIDDITLKITKHDTVFERPNGKNKKSTHQ